MPITREQAMNARLSEWAKRLPLSSEARTILENSVLSQESDCWDWLGPRKPNGYGHLTINRRTHYAHRVSFTALTGRPIPEGMDLCHTCDRRACVNPGHLFVGTRTDNMQDAKRKGRLSQGRAHGERVSKGIKEKKRVS